MYKFLLLPAAFLLSTSQTALSQTQSSSIAGAPAATGSSGMADEQPLIRVEPEYPARARAQAIEGSVTVEFTVNAFGEVEDARVAESNPRGIFDQSALAAVQRWRYAADAEREATLVSERLDFSLTDLVWQLTADSGPSSGITPRNDCVRENIAYDFGEMVEVGLINSCAEPLLVFGCALGTGQHSGKWVCIDSERAETVLLRPGDGRIGSSAFISTVAGTRSFSYGENIFLARAPNTQYWWIACRQADGPCRDSARQWVRSVDRQLASVDPQARAAVAVARSH